jgi:LCP family protein required for cell wall assembly
VPKPATLPDAPRQQHRRLIFTLILLCAVAASYLGLVIVARVERIFFPGNPISVPGGSAISRVLPGIDVSGDTSSDARINILLIGADNDFGAAGKQSGLEHTDSIEVVSVDPKTKSATALGIPRDLWVTIPDRSGGTYQDRVNTPLVMGIVKHYPEGGIGLEKEVIENNLHITIDHYVMINFDGFIKVIDALGGIDVGADRGLRPLLLRDGAPGRLQATALLPGDPAHGRPEGARLLAHPVQQR